MRDSSRSDVHETLLISYATLHVGTDNGVDGTCKLIRIIATAYLPTARVWAAMFSSEQTRSGAAIYGILQDVFDQWRKKDVFGATIAWGRWLLKNGRGKEASELVVNARASLEESACMELEKQWTTALDEEASYVEYDEVESLIRK